MTGHGNINEKIPELTSGGLSELINEKLQNIEQILKDMGEVLEKLSNQSSTTEEK